MFDVGFAELVLVAVVALLVIGPERLPGTVRTATLYLNRLRRSFNEIKQEIQQELHNDAVLRDLRETGEQLKREAQSIADPARTSPAIQPATQPTGQSTGAPAADQSSAASIDPPAAADLPDQAAPILPTPSDERGA